VYLFLLILTIKDKLIKFLSIYYKKTFMSLITVLLEDKRQTLIDKYKNSINLKDFESLLGDFIDKDPSATKKYSEWMIKELIRMWNNPGNRFSSLVDLMNFMNEQIQTFHELSNSITNNDVEYFLKQIDSYQSRGINYFFDESKKNRIQRSPKDIYSYPSIWVVQLMNNSIEERKKVQREEQDAKKEAEKIYEDNRFLIVQPLSHKASCFYGANTKWCTTTKGGEYHFKRYGANGNRLYYIIDKEATGHATLGKMALQIDTSGNASVWDGQDNFRSVDFMLDRFEPISNILEKLVKGDDDYEKIKKVSQGVPSAYREKLSADYFDRFEDEYVYFYFNDVETYLSLLKNEFEEYELRDIEYAIEPPYGYDSYYYDTYNFDDDLKSGYVLNSLNPDHLKILKDILEIAKSELVSCFISRPMFSKENIKKIKEKGLEKIDYYDLYRLEINSTCNDKIGEFLINFDDKFYDNFKYTYSGAYDESLKEGVKKEMTKLLCDIYDQTGLEKVADDNCFTEYRIPVNKLLEYYEDNLESYSGYTIDQMFKDVIVPKKVNYSIPEPRELAYQVSNDEIFSELFDADMLKELENLKDRLEDREDFKDLDEYKSIYVFIANKYGFNQEIPVKPLEGDVTIKLKKIDPIDNKIEFELKRSGSNYGWKKGKAKLSTIQQLITNYQLFDPFED
jgi:hypothetical protein